MTRISSLFCILAATVSGAAGAVPVPLPVHVDTNLLTDAQAEEIKKVVAGHMRRHDFPGLSLAILHQGTLRYAAGFGTKSPGGESPVNADTRFRIASITKPITAVAVLQLHEAGKIELDRPVRTYCPQYPSKPVNPTVRHVLSHQSGIRHTTDREDTSIKGDFESLSEVIPLFAEEKLRFDPGADFLYTSWGYTLLGCVIETVSGTSYMEYLQQRILQPAGMTSTVRDRPDFAAADFSSGFRPRGSRLIPSEVVDTRFKTPASGLISTAVDLAQFVRAMYAGELLQPETVEKMFRKQPTTTGKTGQFTLGWVAASGKAFGDAYYHGGSMEGTAGFVYLIPERRYAVIILANLERSVQELAGLIGPLNGLLLTP